MTLLYNNINSRTKEATPLLADDVYDVCMKARFCMPSARSGRSASLGCIAAPIPAGSLSH